MTVYNQMIQRTGPGFDLGGGSVGDALVPEPLSNSIFQELPKQSAALSLCKKTLLSSKTQRMPVLDVLPVAYWVGGDTGMKQTSQQQWKGVNLVVEELACIIPIPEAYLDDADVPIWDEVQPRLVEAAGQLVDEAVFWGINKPSTWGQSIFAGAVAAGNTVVAGTGVDFGQDVANLGDAMSQTGYSVNGFAGRPGLNWHLTGLRSAQGLPIYNSINSDMSQAVGGNLYGYPISMPDNGSWQSNYAQLIAGDWSKAIVGVRKDISFKMFTEGVISNDAGAVVLNLMQQDAVAMRMTMRLAYVTANPVTIMKPGLGITTRFPFGAVLSTNYVGAGRTDSTGTGTTNGSATVGDTHAVATDQGLPISGTGIPAGSTILAVTPGTGYIISQNATATGTPTLTVGHTVALPTGDEDEFGVPEVSETAAAKRSGGRRRSRSADTGDSGEGSGEGEGGAE